jgi:transposase InsO family protein
VRGMGIRDRPIAARSPWQNSYVERLIGTLRRECLDHVLIFGERHLRRVLTSYAPHAPGIGQGRTTTTRCPTMGNHRHNANSIGIASSLRPDMIFRRDRTTESGAQDNELRR